MGAIVLKYVQLLCVAFFMKNSNCTSIMSKSDEVNNFKIATCIAECLTHKNYVSFTVLKESRQLNLNF